MDSGLIHSHIGVAPAHQNFMSSNHLDLKNTSSSLVKYWLTQSFNRKHVSFIFCIFVALRMLSGFTDCWGVSTERMWEDKKRHGKNDG